MEGRLFFIAIWCGVYGQLLRLVFRPYKFLQTIWVTMLMNAFFWATGMALLGMLLSSYFEKIDDMAMYSLLFATLGFLLGAAKGYLVARDEKKREALLKDNLEWADTGFSAILLASFVMFFLVQAFKIPSGSMRMTFVEGDHLFVNKFIYGFPIPLTKKKIFPLRKVTPGDIVIFRFPTTDKTGPHYGKDFIKRVIAIQGQRVQIINKQVFVDGKSLEESYKDHVDSIVFPGMEGSAQVNFQSVWDQGLHQENDIRDNFGPVVVPPKHVLVMGDNRDRSYDSRFWGPLPLDQIKGMAWLLYWPLPRFHLVR